MSLIDDILSKLGAVYDRAHLFSFAKVSAPGAYLRFTRDLRPLPDTGLTGGHLLELYAVLDERHLVPDANSKIRFDVLEEDFLLLGGLDDRIISLLGPGAGPPEPGAPTRQVTTEIHQLPDGQDVASFVEDYKRRITAFQDTILLLTRSPDGVPPRPQCSHLIAWLRVEHDDIGAHSELYFELNIAGAVRAASPVLEIQAAPPGVSVRLRGSLTDAAPLVAATPEPLPDVPVSLGGRRAVTGPAGDFVIDARLGAGDHPLLFARPGIDPLTCTVRVSVDGQGLATASALDPQGAELATATTAAASTEQSVLLLEMPSPIPVVAHKLRGTVMWPDSLPGDVPADYHGTALAERRVYVLPVPPGTTIAEARPQNTREWEDLKHRPGVLRSSRPGRPAGRERTDTTGRFEVRYVDLAAGSRFLIWVERFDPLDPTDTGTESPDLIVRTFRRELIEIHNPALTTFGQADQLLRQHRNLVDHDYTHLTGDCVPVAVEALRVADFPAPDGLSLVRPRQTARVLPPLLPVVPSDVTRTDFETQEPLAVDTGDNLRVPASKAVGTLASPDAAVQDGLTLIALPLVPLFEDGDAQGGAAKRAVAALASQGDSAFTDYADIPPAAVQRLVAHERGAVRLVLDSARLDTAVDYGFGPAGSPLEPDRPARVVKLLESTFIVRPQLGAGNRLGVEQARWHIDAVSLADSAFVGLRVNQGTVANRALSGLVQPVLGAVSPLLPALAPRRIYLAPGHGLFPAAPDQGSATPAAWRTTRGGYAENAGEDEVDLLLAAELARILEACGARRGLRSCREVFNFTTPGVSNPGAGNFTPVADPDFPRLWQQNSVFYLGFTGDLVPMRAQLLNALLPLNTGPPQFIPQDAMNAPAGNRDGAGIFARARHIRWQALTPMHGIDLVFAQHTNALGLTAAPGQPAPAENAAARGLMVEFLDVSANIDPVGALSGEGNSLGRALATRLHSRMGQRLNIRQRGVQQMGPAVNAEGVRDLFDTYDHWAHGDVPNLTVPRLDHQPPPAQAAGWNQAVFERGGAALRIPVALAEHGFHDNRDDAQLLGRAWFRRLAGEGAALAIDAQLQDAAGPVSNADVRAVLRRTFGDSAAVRALPVAGNATPASLADALRAVGDPAAAQPAASGPADLAGGAMLAARALSRQQLVDLMRDAVRTVAGWEATDAAATIDLWVSRAVTDGVALDRPAQPPTRAEAGVLACNAVGLVPACITTAETVAVGAPGTPLIRPAAVAAGQSAFFARVEADALVARLGTLAPKDVYRVAGAYLADGSWPRPDMPRGSDSYELDRGTPLTVVFRTAGVPWKTLGQTATNGGVQDVEIVIDAGGRRIKLGCAGRATSGVASATWFLDLAPTQAALPVTLELWARHRAATSPLLVGSKRIKVMVRQSQAP